MSTDWTDKLKSKVESYSQPAPEGLWEEIAASSAAAGKKKHSPLFLAIPILAAACAAALLVIPSRIPEPNVPATVMQATTGIEMMPSATENKLLAEAKPMQKSHSASINSQTETTSEAQSHEPVPVEEAPDQTPSTEQVQIKTEPKQEWVQWEEFDEPVKASKHEMTISMNFGASSGQYTNTDAVMALSSSTDATALRHEPVLYGSNDMFKTTPEDYEWHVSYRMNMLAQYYIKSKMHISTGVSLTALEGNTSYELRRTSMYQIGIPVSVGYDLFQAGRMSASAGIGGTAALCLKSAKGFDAGRFQLSSDYMLNIRYSLARSIAIQGGIGASTYFPSGKNGIFDRITTLANVSAGLVWYIN